MLASVPGYAKTPDLVVGEALGGSKKRKRMRTRIISQAETAEAWTNPEFWPSPGLGCSWCHDGIPIVFELSFGGALCPECLMRCLGCTWQVLEAWLVRMRTVHIRNTERAAVWASYHRGDFDAQRLNTEYSEKYGVDLLGRM